VHVGTLELRGIMTLHGPHIAGDRGRPGVVPLGRAAWIGRSGSEEWGIYKYQDGQRCIDLAGLTSRQIRRIADEFGIESATHNGYDIEFIYSSPAWNGLVCWIKDSPPLPEPLRSDHYLPGWHDRALSQTTQGALPMPARRRSRSE
jgi:hypothetical protein